jgi:hypothetical protein
MVDATKIAKLRAKALSTGYPEEAAMFERKAAELTAQHGIAEADIDLALQEIFGRRPARQPHQAEPWPDDEPVEFVTMIEAAIWVFEEEDNRPMRAREIWTLIESRELYNRSRGKTPWATIASKLATETTIFERVAPGLYRLRRSA